ncbi:Spindle and centriole-associated protein 1 [Folsomia candida]|uniref:Spindle and centriole-associated protein 1 n=1 Tax=Folsomia candida TaxID=158441 RepID=A0A226DIB8_FOLCA|nr:Spindle and centriole-associated protein 1 [Folsomia candida]
MDKLEILCVVTILALSCANCEEKNPIELLKLFEGIGNCDLQIVHGDLESANIQPFPNLLLPTSLIFASIFARQRPWLDYEDWDRFSIDTSNTRVSYCQLSVLFSSQFIEDGKEIKFWHWIRFGTDRHFRFGKFGKEWSTSTSNTYVVLVTNYDMTEFAKVSLEKYVSVSSIENFGIVFNQGTNNLLEVCVLRSGVMPEIQNFNCMTNFQSSFLEKFHALQTKLQNWELKILVNTDISLPKEFKDGDTVEFIKYPQFINPFDRDDFKSSIHQHIAQSVFRKSNSTLSFCQRKCSLTYHGSIQFDGMGMLHLSPTKVWVTVGFTSYQFLSCYSEKEITFRFYIVPFKREVWFGILSCGVMVYLMMQFFVRFFTKVRDEFPIWMTVLAGIFDTWGHIPEKVEQRNVTRYLLGGWALACLVLTNFYSGLMISELNSPMARNRPEIFSDLVCSLEDAQLFHSEGRKNLGEKISTKMNETLTYLDDFKLKLFYNILQFPVPPELTNIPFLEEASCFRLLSPVRHGRLKGSIVFDFEDYLYSWYYQFREIVTFNPLSASSSQVLLNLFHPRHARRPRIVGGHLPDIRYAMEKEITSCAKTAFIGESFLIAAEIEYLRKKYFWTKFHKGRDTLIGDLIGWVIEKEGRMQSVSRSYRALIESGIYERLRVEITARKMKGRKQTSESIVAGKYLELIVMNGGILTLFIMTFFIDLVAFVCFLSEFHSLVGQKIVPVIMGLARLISLSWTVVINVKWNLGLFERCKDEMR